MFKEELKEKVDKVEKLLQEHTVKEEGRAKVLYESMNYSLFAGGKRIRPVLLLEVFSMLRGANSQMAEVFAVAVEMIHTFSLIHDDLPAMDNDDYRRGKLTNHKVYDEAIAVLAGDSLMTYAYEKVIDEIIKIQQKDVPLRALKVLMNAISPIDGIHAGQVVDVISESNAEIDIDTLRFIHEYKTTIFIRACLKVGAILAEASEEEVEALDKYGYNIGLAFQIKDDILDVVGNSQVIGKPVGSDQKNDKATYVKLVGVEESKNEVKKLTSEAVEIVENQFGTEKAGFLIELAKYLETRKK